MDKTITCKTCGTEFQFSERDQQFYQEKGYNEPQNCKECRVKRKREWEEKQRSNYGSNQE